MRHKNFKLVSVKHVHALQLYIEPKIYPSVVTQALIPYVMSLLYPRTITYENGKKKLLFYFYHAATTKDSVMLGSVFFHDI